jgi:hypothetical protein
MSEINTQEEINKNIKALNSDNPLILKDTLVSIREKGHSKYIPVLVDLLLKNKDGEKLDLIRSFIADIKDSFIKTSIIDALKDEKYKTVRKELISICWESAVDFSEHMSLFIDIIIEENFNSSFEALTVIENLETSIESNIIKKEIDKLKSAANTTDEARRYLIHETVNLLEERIA